MYCTLYFSLILSVIKLHVFTSRDENSVDPDQVGSWLIWICSVLKKKDKPRFSMKVVNIHQLLCTVDSKIHENCCKQKYKLNQVMGTLYR